MELDRDALRNVVCEWITVMKGKAWVYKAIAIYLIFIYLLLI